jgi:DNA-binding response OmpR family regulator
VILLVDDFEDALDIYGQYLTFRGHRVVVARSGAEALESAQRHRPDIILLDVSMPGLSGIDVLRILRADKRFAQSPIVALTARALESERVEALKAGFDEVIPKPCLPDDLAASIQRILRSGVSGPRILLATDIEDHTITYEAALLRHGFVVQSTRTGAEALAIAEAFRPACAVIDLRLPDMPGWEVCRALKARPETAKARVIVLTQELTPETATRSRKFDCHAWLTRPTAADHLVETVRQVLTAKTENPASPDLALLGTLTCPACQSGHVIAGVRISAVQYYCCVRCRFCWRVTPMGSA